MQATAYAAATTKMYRQSPRSMRMPATSREAAPAATADPEISATAIGTRSAGRCSRASPMHSGRIAPATPWIARPAMMASRVPNAMLTIEPVAAQASTNISTRSRPYMSPSRPHTAAEAAATSRNAVTVHPTAEASASKTRANVGSAAYIIDVSNALMTSTAMRMATTAHTGRVRS